MKILLLAHDMDTTAGSGRNTATISTVLRAAGHEVTVLGYKKDFWQFVKVARQHAKTSDVVHTIDMNPLGFAGYLATRGTRAKLVIIAQAAYAVAPLYNLKTALFSQIVYRSADAVVVGSTFVADEIQKKVSGLKVTVIDPGINISKFSEVSTRQRSTNEAPFILGVGAVKARKGYDVSLRAFALVKKDIPNLRYVIVGSQTDEPRYFKMLVELSRELGVLQDVDFLTKVPDRELNDLYEQAALFVLASVNIGFHFEGFGMVFLEAAAHGLPSVGTLGNGIADAIEDGKTGILVPQKDPAATAAAMRRILTDKPLAERMRTRARAFAQEHGQGHLIRRYEQLYSSLFS